MILSDDFKKSIKLLKRQQIYQKNKYHQFYLIDQTLFFTMTIMNILNHLNLGLVNIGIIHQKLEEIVGQRKTLLTSFLLLLFCDTAFLDATKPNYVFGLTNASDTVIISCDLSKQTCTMDGFEINQVNKWHYDHRKTNFLKNSKCDDLLVLTPIELKEVRDILKDPGFEIPKNTLY